MSLRLLENDEDGKEDEVDEEEEEEEEEEERDEDAAGMEGALAGEARAVPTCQA